MNIKLEEYGDFATKIGLTATKKDGVFKYIHKPTGIEIKPFELGELYRLFLSQYTEGVQCSLNHFEAICKNKEITKDTLPKAFKEEIESQKIYIQELKNKLK